MENGFVTGVKKIAVFRATALGDFIFALPALDALHHTYPQAEIIYLGRAWHAEFIPGRVPGITRVLALPPAKGEQIAQGLVIDPEAEEDSLRRLQAASFDIALQMQGGGVYSNPFVRAMGARLTAGAKAPEALPLDRWIPYTYYQPEVIRMLDIAALVGAHTDTRALNPSLSVLPADLEAAERFFEKIQPPFAVLHPGSTDPRRCWSPQSFAQVADRLHEEHGLQIVLTGVNNETRLCETVMQSMRCPALNLCSQLSLAALTGLLSRAVLLVCNDTGPLHLALAVGTRAVGLFWAEYVVNSMPLSRARFLPLIAWENHCPGCGEPVHRHEAAPPPGGCTHEVSFINSIQPEQVMQAAQQLLESA